MDDQAETLEQELQRLFSEGYFDAEGESHVFTRWGELAIYVQRMIIEARIDEIKTGLNRGHYCNQMAFEKRLAELRAERDLI